MLLELAHQEREHADTFERLYNQTAKEKDELDDTYLFEPEISQYLAAMVQTAVFPSEEKQDEVLTNIKDVEDVLRIGIQAEKDSILFLY
jgi:rubrerythrin